MQNKVYWSSRESYGDKDLVYGRQGQCKMATILRLKPIPGCCALMR